MTINVIKRRGADLKIGSIYTPVANSKDWYRCTTKCRPPRTPRPNSLKGSPGRRGKGVGRGGIRNKFYSSTPVYIRTK